MTLGIIGTCLAAIVSALACTASRAPSPSGPADPPLPQDADPTLPAASRPEPVDTASIAHLPDGIQHDILAWRKRLTEATCLKIVCDSDQTWADFAQLDASGSPHVVLREHFIIHSWMTHDVLWAVIFGVKDGAADETTPLFQEYWDAKAGKAWERLWVPETSSYTVRRYECAEIGGPPSPGFPSHGCNFAGPMNSWLSGPTELGERVITVRSIALLRLPNLAIVPPDPTQPGVWLDVFTDKYVRNEDDEASRSLYRRRDFMLLARDAASRPEVREWRTLVLSDPKQGGKEPQQSVGTNRFTYTFFETTPPELRQATDSFVRDVELALDHQ